MALRRDPLDELIADLERTVPVRSEEAIFTDDTLVGCQILVNAMMYGTQDDVERVKEDRRVRAYLRELEILAARRGRPSGAQTQGTVGVASYLDELTDDPELGWPGET